MSSTIKCDFQAKRREIEDFRNANEKWVLNYEPLFTHAITLTFNHTKIRRQMMEIDSSLCLNSPQMVELYRANMRSFKWKLVKGLYGNAWQRFSAPFVFIPILEGLRKDEKPHYHCMVGVSRDRFEVLSEKITSIWTSLPFGGNRIDVQTYMGIGWARYSTKNALFVNRESIDWENVLVPQHKSLVE